MTHIQPDHMKNCGSGPDHTYTVLYYSETSNLHYVPIRILLQLSESYYECRNHKSLCKTKL